MPAAASEASEVKLHRRELMLDRKQFTVLSPRPTTPHRFATNFYHETWHVLSDAAGAHLLGRMCWSMAYQRNPNTIMVIDYPLLVSNPFDADQSMPIVLSNRDLGGLSALALGQLKHQLPFTSPSRGTVRLTSPGLDRLLAGQGDLGRAQQESGEWWNKQQHKGVTDCVKGMVVFAAHPPMLQWWALHLSGLGEKGYSGSDYASLNWSPESNRPGGTGEVQVFERFTTMVSQAREARNRVYPYTSNRELLPEERERVWAALPKRK
jgi:hypothetical protein